MQWRKPTRNRSVYLSFNRAKVHVIKGLLLFLSILSMRYLVHVEKSRCCATCKLSLYISDIKFYKKFMLFNYLKELNGVEVKKNYNKNSRVYR